MSAVRVARAATRRDKIIKFEGCYHGHADAFLVQAGSGAMTLGVPTSPGVPAAAAPTRCSRATTISRRSSGCSISTADEIAAVFVEPIAGNMGVVAPRDGFLEGLRALCDREGALLVFDEVISGFRAGGRRRAAGVRRQAGPDLPRQDHRRRAAGRRVRRPRGRDGAGRAGGPGLSGRHAVGQSAGDDRRAVVADRAVAEAVSAPRASWARRWPPASPTRRATPACRCRSTRSARC